VSPPPATPPPPATKGPSRAAKRRQKKQQEEAAREARIEQEKAAPASSPPPRAPGTPASLGEFARWAARQSELAGRSDEPLAALAALAAPSSRGGGWDERGRLQALLLRWEAAEAGPSPQLSPRYRQRGAEAALARHGHVDSLRLLLRSRSRLDALLLGDSHFERLQKHFAPALPRGTAVHAVGGDGVEHHLLLRLHAEVVAKRRGATSRRRAPAAAAAPDVGRLPRHCPREELRLTLRHQQPDRRHARDAHAQVGPVQPRPGRCRAAAARRSAARRDRRCVGD